jgi:transcriptional regulator with XRE-family HTH domain
MENEEAEEVREAFATVLRQRRNALGVSQEELAHRAGLAMRYVSLLETNKRQPTISTMWSLCQALGVSMTDFVRGVEARMSEK